MLDSGFGNTIDMSASNGLPAGTDTSVIRL